MDRLEALRIAREQGNTDEALSALRAVIREDPDDEECVLTAAFMIMQLGRHAEASELLALVSGSAIDPATPTLLGQALMAQGRMDEAMKVLTDGIARFSTYPKIYEVRGDINFYKHRFKEALEDRRKAVYLQKSPQVRLYTALVNSILSASSGYGYSPSEIAYVCNMVKAEADGARDGELFEFAESIFQIKDRMDLAAELVERVMPCPGGFKDETLRWRTVEDYCKASSSVLLPIDAGEPLPGLPTYLVELRNASVAPSLQWIPILRDSGAILSGFASLRLRTARENTASPLLLNNRFAARLRLPSTASAHYEEAIVLGGMPQYYHNTIDYFSRLALVAGRPEYERLPILVNSDLAEFQRAFFAAAGVSADRLILVAPEEVVEVRRAIVPAMLARGGRQVHPYLPAWYRSVFVKDSARPDERKRKLYVSRGEGLKRRLGNERELVKSLQERGFEMIDPAQLTVTEQVDLFSQAEVVVAPTGASLSNMVFMPSGGLIVSLIGGYLSHSPGSRWFDVLALACGHRYAEVSGVSGEFTGGRLIDADFEVDVTKVLSALDERESRAC